MTDKDYFIESVPDGISNAINALDPSIECCNQDSYELLIATFGEGVCGSDLKNATEKDFLKFAQSMKEWFELEKTPPMNDAKRVISQALSQWGG